MVLRNVTDPQGIPSSTLSTVSRKIPSGLSSSVRHCHCPSVRPPVFPAGPRHFEADSAHPPHPSLHRRVSPHLSWMSAPPPAPAQKQPQSHQHMQSSGNHQRDTTGRNETSSSRRPSTRSPGRRNTWESRGGQARKRRKPQHPTPAIAYPQNTKWTCSVCQAVDTPNQYRCPRCDANYCSMACCRVHKQTDPPCEKKETFAPQKRKSKYMPVDHQITSTSSRPTTHKHTKHSHNYEDLEEGWKMTNEMTQKMHRSQWLHTELQDTGLQSLIQQIATASNAVSRHPNQPTEQERLLKQLKHEYPQFRKFIDKLLVMTGILLRQNDDTPLDTWLQQEHSIEDHEERQQLVLMPMPSRRASRKLPGPQESSSSSDGDDSSDEGDSSESDNDQ